MSKRTTLEDYAKGEIDIIRKNQCYGIAPDAEEVTVPIETWAREKAKTTLLTDAIELLHTVLDGVSGTRTCSQIPELRDYAKYVHREVTEIVEDAGWAGIIYDLNFQCKCEKGENT